MESISDIRNRFKTATEQELSELLRIYGNDSRSGVQKLVLSGNKKLQDLEAERERVRKMRFYEDQYADLPYICGIDEVGRGPLAGPVAAGAVILPRDVEILYLNDSKKLSEKKREELYDVIMEKAISAKVSFRDEKRIDEINILQADYEAMAEAVESLSVQPSLLLLDAVHVPQLERYKQVSIIKGDAKSVSIAAASIIAKVSRDRYMMEMDKLYPEYGFAQNKGYGSAQHIAAIRKYGPCPIHRRSFIGNFI